MVELKKIKSSTLMETLIATVLIVIVFVLSSMILNNVFSNSINNNTQSIESHLNELHYLYTNNKLILPYQEALEKWQITIDEFQENGNYMVEFEAVNTTTNKSISLINYEVE